MGLTKTFETKLFFPFGRHIWNIIGVSGFVAVLTGLILFIEATPPPMKSKQQFLGNSSSLYAKTKEQYFGKEYLNEEILIEKNKNKLGKLNYESYKKNMKGKVKEDGYMGYTRWAFSNYAIPRSTDPSKWRKLSDGSDWDYVYAHSVYRKRQYLNYLLGSYTVRKIEQQDKDYKKYLKSFPNKRLALEENYKQYKKDYSIKYTSKIVQRATSLPVMAWGFAVLSFSSLASAVFSIERNSRNK